MRRNSSTLICQTTLDISAMRQTRAGHHRPVPKLATFIPRDFDQIEETEDELVRQVQHGHSFAADGMTEKPSQGKIYSL